MANRSAPKTHVEYIQSQPVQTREKLTLLRALIREAAPGCEELFNYNIPAFALVKGGKREEKVMIAGYAKHVGFYPHPRTIEHFSDDLTAYKSAKGSVQFPLDEPLPNALIIRMVKWRLQDLRQKAQ